MKQELDDLLCTLAPKTCRDRKLPANETPFAFGFEVCDGWFTILKDMVLELEALNMDLRLAQVKVKYGYLTVYLKTQPKEADPIINKAVNRAAKTCEDCGEPGTRHMTMVLCPEHLQEARDKDTQ